MTEVKKVFYLSVKDIKVIYRGITLMFKDIEPLPSFNTCDLRKLEASLVLPKQTVFGKELYPTIEEKASILYYAINRNHAFKNGNKRMSSMCLVVFLVINKFILDINEQELTDKTLWLGLSGDSFEDVKQELVRWIKENIKYR